MNAIRFRVMGGEDTAIVVRSTVDRTWQLAPKTDEQIQFGRDDMVSIKNRSEHRVLVKLKRTKCTEGDIVIRSSRRAAFLLDEDDTQLWFQAGEVLNIRSTEARNPTGAGPGGLTV